MAAGDIYVGGAVRSLGSDAMLTDIDEAEVDDIRAFLDRYEIAFKGSLQKIVNAGKRLRYATSEQQVRSIPFFTFSGTSDYWNPKVQEDVYIKSQIGRYRVRGYGGARALPHLSDLAFKRDLSRAGTAGDPVAAVEMYTEIGGLNGAKPLTLSMPVMIAPMSYGALSRSTKQAVGMASSMAGIAENTGEGGMSDAQRGAAEQLVFQCLGGRLGWNIHDMNRADGLEIYISQGAKPGFGGQLMAKKVTKELATIRGIPEGIDLRSPSRHPDILGADDLVIKVEEFREATGYRIPVSVKLGAGRVRDDIKIAFKDGFDFVELDGMQGSTGAGGAEVMEHVGVPTLAAITQAIEALGEVEGLGKMQVVLMGGIRDGIDAVKGLCLGADAVAMGTAVIIAGGLHCLHAVSCGPVRDRYRDPGPDARAALQPGGGGAQHPPLSGRGALANRGADPGARLRKHHRTEPRRPGGAHPRRCRDDGAPLCTGIPRPRAGAARQGGLSDGEQGVGGGRSPARRTA